MNKALRDLAEAAKHRKESFEASTFLKKIPLRPLRSLRELFLKSILHSLAKAARQRKESFEAHLFEKNPSAALCALYENYS